MNFDIDPETILAGVEAAFDALDYRLSQETMDEVVKTIDNCIPGIVEIATSNTEEAWHGIAEGAKGWGTKYSRAIKSKYSGLEGSVFLDASTIDKQSGKPNLMFAMMMERGVQSWSIRDALMKSERVKISSEGVKYITIPFPVSTPRKNKQGTMQSYFGGREMSSQMHELVKAGEKAPAGSYVTVTTAHGSKRVNVEGLMRYNTRKYHSQYGFFRRVSENSKGWQYPSIPAQPVFRSVKEYVDRRMKEIMEEFCENIVKEFTS